MNNNLTMYPGEKKYSPWKRIGIYLLDVLLIAISYVILFFGCSRYCVMAIEKDNINTINEQVVIVLKSENVEQYQQADWQYKLIGIDRNAYLTYLVEEENMEVEKAFEEYDKLEARCNEKLKNDVLYQNAYRDVEVVHYTFKAISALIPIFIFTFLIPLLTKKTQTIGSMAAKSGFCTKKHNTRPPGWLTLCKFLFIYLIEYFLLSLFTYDIGILIVIIVNIACISFTPSKSTIEDLITFTHIAYTNYIYTDFSTDVEESDKENESSEENKTEDAVKILTYNDNNDNKKPKK